MQGEDNIRSLSAKIKFIYIRCETGKMFQINMALYELSSHTIFTLVIKLGQNEQSYIIASFNNEIIIIYIGNITSKNKNTNPINYKTKKCNSLIDRT
jgi:hypothetical protein